MIVLNYAQCLLSREVVDRFGWQYLKYKIDEIFGCYFFSTLLNFFNEFVLEGLDVAPR